MRHAKQRLQLNRFTSWRKSTLISIAKSLLVSQRIITTKTKARAARPLIEKLITLGKHNSLTARRNAYKVLSERKLVTLLFKDIAPRFSSRKCGYTRILPWTFRRGDNAELVILELTERAEKKEKPKKQKALPAEEIREIPKEEAPKPKPKVFTEQKAPPSQKPSKKFFGGLRKIFKKKSDSL
jgi:large subunit ribosomal protein L17